jgi:demethylmenaquinone methyltransferase/2-methoxy-6-polyprenyl-1,4-benzoquinol methylase
MASNLDINSAAVGSTPEPGGLGSGAMFDAIAKRYDLLNRLISLGVDQRWRRRTVQNLNLGQDSAQVLDVATGTADLALLIARTHPNCRVVGLDPSVNMLEVARQKVNAQGLDSRVELVTGTAEALPFADHTFAGSTIAFGIRNVPDRPKALREMARVTRAGGRVCILELSEPRGGLLGHFARFHMHRVVPRLGALLSGAKQYRYLPNSIRAFPDRDTFCRMMEEAGLRVISAEPLTFGVCHLYVGAAQ